MTDKNLKNC